MKNNLLVVISISILFIFSSCDQKGNSENQEVDKRNISKYAIEGVWETMGDTTGLQSRFGEDADSIFQILEKIATIKVALRKDKYVEMIFGYKAADRGKYYFNENRDSLFIKLDSDKDFKSDYSLYLLYDENKNILSSRIKSKYGDELGNFKKMSDDFYHILK